MKRITLAVFLAFATWAMAGTVIKADYNQNSAVNISPNLKASNNTLGIPVVNPVNKQQQLNTVNVTIADLDDGGAGDTHSIIGCHAWAWKYAPELRNADGGQGWVRFPAMDFDCDGLETKASLGTNYQLVQLYADGGTGTDGTKTSTATAVMFSRPVPPLRTDSRIYYQTYATADGGLVLNDHRVIINGIYFVQPN